MPKYTIDVPVGNLSAGQYLALATIAVEKLEWNLEFISATGLIARVPMSWKANTWGEKITIIIENGNARITSKSEGGTLIDFGRNKKNLRGFAETLEALKVHTTEQELTERIIWVHQNTASAEEDILNPASTAAKEEKKWWKVFIPTRDFLLTPILIIINVVLFLAMLISSGNISALISPDTNLLIQWGANYKPSTVEGQWWRLFTCMFEHIGIIHLLLNMYALLYVGAYLEPLMGKVRFIISYILTGIMASLTSLWWHDYAVSAGASGAIFGMYGVFLALLLTNLIDKDSRKSLLQSIGIFVLYNLVFGIRAGIDNAAHIGGLLSGLIVGFVYYFSLIDRSNILLKGLLSFILIILTSMGVLLVVPKVNNPAGEYLKLMEQYSEYELEALNVQNLPATSSEMDIVQELTGKTIPNWQRCQREVAKLNQLDLPDHLKEYCRLLGEYTDAQLKFSQVLLNAVSEFTNKYDAELEELQKEIKRIREQLGQ